jgi:uncharacterized protein (DUF1697 family)
MPVFVALLRGINVGTAKRLPMASLRDLLTGLGYADVATLLNSGNAVFRAAGGPPARHAAAISAAIAKRLRLDVPVVVKTARELDTIVSENPLATGGSDPSRLLVAFTPDSRTLSTLGAVKAVVIPPERFVVGRNAAYLLCPAGILKSKAWDALLGKPGAAATTRNWATVLKLQALASASASGG